MNINFRQSQFELFPGAQGAAAEAGKPRFFFANLTISFENLVVVVIVSLMMMVLSYSYGVERGKRVVVAQYFKPEKGGDASVAPKAIAKAVPATVRPQGAAKGIQVDSVTTVPTAGNSSSPKDASALGNNIAIPAQKTLQSPQSVVYSQPQLAAPSEKPFTVQVASYKTQEYAQKEAQDLKSRGYESLVMPKGAHIIVCVGRFAQQQEAQIFSESFSKKFKEYKDCLVRRL